MEGVFVMGKRVNTATWNERQKRWRINVQKDGERKTFYSSTPGRRGQREANSKADLWLDDGVDGSAKTSIMIARFINSLKDRHVSREHIEQNEKFLRLYATPKIGNKKIGTVTEEHLQNIITYAHSIGNKGNGLSYKTLKNLRAVLRSFIKYCRIAQVTTLFPESLMIPNDAQRSSRSALQPDDIKTLFSSDKTTYRGKVIRDWYIHAYRLETIIGLRPGELLGLDISDISETRCTVSRSINRYGEITRGKDKNALREIALRTFEIPKIGLAEIRAQRKMLLSAGVQSDALFPTPDGERTVQRVYLRNWNRYSAFNKISEKSPYELRHTFFSVGKDIPEELIKPIGGHSKSFDGFATYSHEQDGDAARAAQMIDDAFKRMLGE